MTGFGREAGRPAPMPMGRFFQGLVCGGYAFVPITVVGAGCGGG